MSRLWPVGEAAQADYERLREAVVLSGRLPDDVASARFARRGLAGLIAWPEAEPVFVAIALGADRPPWRPIRRSACRATGSCLRDARGSWRP